MALEPAGVIDNPGMPLAAGAPLAVDPSPPDEERGDAPVAASDTEEPSGDPAVVVAKDPAPDASAAPAEQSLNEAKVRCTECVVRIAWRSSWGLQNLEAGNAISGQGEQGC